MQKVLQCIRHIDSNGGASGVAFALELELRKKFIEINTFTLRQLGVALRNTANPKSIVSAKAILALEVIYFTLVGTLLLKYRHTGKCKDSISICHGDCLWGDIYINHGLHRGMLLKSGRPWLMLLRNPLHIFLAIREWLRLYLGVHNFIVCFCDDDAFELKRLYPKNKSLIKIIPNGVATEKFYPDKVTGRECKQALGLNDSNFYLLFVGYEFERKGLSLLIKALKLLPPSVCLIVVGGQSTGEINKYKNIVAEIFVEERVKFLGKRMDMPNIYNAVDIFVLPSSYETWALVGLEAMACGIPGLMTREGGIKEYLQDGVNGFFIERNATSIADKVSTLINNYDLRITMSAAARKTALKYSWDQIADQYINLIAEVAENKKNA